MARHDFPNQVTPFVGREREIAVLRALLGNDDPSAGPSRAGITATLTSGQARLVTLTGPGGIGKTRLAMQVAAELTEAFPDGVTWVDLAPVSDPTLVISAIAEALGVPDNGGRSAQDAVVERLQEARLLVLLDNFEQVRDASGVVDGLLRACPRLVLMVTSRAPLQLRAEHEFPVPPLSLPDGAESLPLESLAQFEAVVLFVERTRAIRPEFAVTDANASAVVEICARLDGLPLAIELAAARLRLLTPEAMLTRLGHGLALLTGGRRDLPARQQTLRSTIAWSCGLLEPVEQQAFRRLAVFVGGFTLDAAESVVTADAQSIDVVDIVERLVAQSLVRLDRETGADPRFRMLETIREYALEQLEQSQEGDDVRDRHLRWCADLGERMASDVGGAEQAVWLNRLDAEHDNMRGALGWAVRTGDRGHHGLRLAASLCTNFWAMRGHHREGRAWLGQLLAHTPARTGPRAQALRGAGRLALRQNDYPAATAAFTEALAIFRELGDRYGIAQTLGWFGVVPHHLGRYDEAQAMLEESLAISREIGNIGEQSIALRFLADLAQDRGDLVRAALRYEETLTLARARQVPHDIAYALRGLGHVARAQGQYALAGERLRESLALLKPLRDRRCIPLTLEGLACIHVGPAWADRAARILGAAQVMQATTGAPSPPSAAADYRRTVADARLALGPDPFERAWAAGAAMSLDEAIDLALSPPDDESEPGDGLPLTAVRVASQDRDVPLSVREREVVALIADGLSNREIAERLVLSVRTVERHIENVYHRLGISGKAGRAIVTAYALRHGLVEPTGAR